MPRLDALQTGGQGWMPSEPEDKAGRWRRNRMTIITINLCKMKEKETPEHKNKIVDDGESMKKKKQRYRKRKTVYLSSGA